MGKKRKADASRLDEADRNLYADFRAAANGLSQLYSQTATLQRLSFQSGERHALEKLYQRIARQREQGSQVATEDIVAYIKDKIEYDTDDLAQVFPSAPGNNNSQTVSQSPHSDAPDSCNIPSVGFSQQAENSRFLNTLRNPVNQSPQNHHSTDISGHCNYSHFLDNIPSSNEARNQGPLYSFPDPPHTSDDCTDTDMQTDNPSQKSTYRFMKHE